MAGIPDKTIIFRKFDLWWPLLTSIFTWAKKWPKWLRTGSLRAVDRRIARPSSFPSFRVRGGGGILAPPPWRRWLRPSPGRGLVRGIYLFLLPRHSVYPSLHRQSAVLSVRCMVVHYLRGMTSISNICRRGGKHGGPDHRDPCVRHRLRDFD